MKTSFKSTANFSFIMISFIFFGCMVWKKIIVEVCFFRWKYRQILIEIYQNHKILNFCWNFVPQLRKSKLLPLRLQKIMKASLKSTVNSLFIMIWNKFILEVFFFYLKYFQMSIEIHQNLKFLVFCRNFSQKVDFEQKNDV